MITGVNHQLYQSVVKRPLLVKDNSFIYTKYK